MRVDEFRLFARHAQLSGTATAQATQAASKERGQSLCRHSCRSRIREVRPVVVGHRLRSEPGALPSRPVRRSKKLERKMPHHAIVSPARASVETLLLGLLPCEQAAHRLPCPSEYHEYDNPTLLEKCKREGKKAQLLR